jgi:predicted heme/steroid binding protein
MVNGHFKILFKGLTDSNNDKNIKNQKTNFNINIQEEISKTKTNKQETDDYCGNGIVEIEETSQNCCIDVGCAEGYECENNICVIKNCINLNEVKNSDRCLVVFNNKVYDLTNAKKWSLSGHEGKHYCGEIYDTKTIDKGPHKKEAESLMRKYFLKELC